VFGILWKQFLEYHRQHRILVDCPQRDNDSRHPSDYHHRQWILNLACVQFLRWITDLWALLIWSWCANGSFSPLQRWRRYDIQQANFLSARYQYLSGMELRNQQLNFHRELFTVCMLTLNADKFILASKIQLARRLHLHWHIHLWPSDNLRWRQWSYAEDLRDWVIYRFSVNSKRCLITHFEWIYSSIRYKYLCSIDLFTLIILICRAILQDYHRESIVDCISGILRRIRIFLNCLSSIHSLWCNDSIAIYFLECCQSSK